MRAKPILLILINVSLAHASTNSQTFLFGKTTVTFTDFDVSRITISSNCIKNSKVGDCAAIRGLKTVSFKKIERPKFGGANPGALICEQQLHGIVMVGINQNTKNENSFCKLADGSIIDNGTLIFYGRKNDGEKAEKQMPPNKSSGQDN